MKNKVFFTLLIVFFSVFLDSKVVVSSLFSDHGVIQRGTPIKVWGWANPSEKIAVDFVGKTLETVADSKGNWSVTFPAQKVGDPKTLKITGENTLVIKDLLFGEVWVASGQSNMEWSLKKIIDGDLEPLLANDPQLRILKVNNRGSQTPQKDIDGYWTLTNEDSVKDFSAVGYYFARDLRRALGVPVGLIVNARGGSAAEAWVPRENLESDSRYYTYLNLYDRIVANYNHEVSIAVFKKKLAHWKTLFAKAKKTGKFSPRKPKHTDPRYSQLRPANLWNSRIYPLLNYGIKGVIWYQGETNTNKNRSYDYRYLLPMLIKTWRDHWGIGKFPFYWSQLTNFDKKEESQGVNSWAEMRESMTLTKQSVANTGQAVTTDLGEAKDIHPRRKLEVARRLLRWALAKDYGYDLLCQSPEFLKYNVQTNKVLIILDQTVKTLGLKDVLGFSVAGKDQKFIPAKAKISGKHVIVWHEDIPNPIAVRYNWGNNPEGNVISHIDLPLTPFRTDSWKLNSQIID